MTVLIDSSIWIEYLRNPAFQWKMHFQELIDDFSICMVWPVWVELISGASSHNMAKLERILSPFMRVGPDEETWRLIAQWAIAGAVKGQRFGVGDLLIGALAAQQDIPVWSDDKDFTRMAKMGFVRLYRPPPD